jgi:hypothetical protein
MGSNQLSGHIRPESLAIGQRRVQDLRLKVTGLSMTAFSSPSRVDQKQIDLRIELIRLRSVSRFIEIFKFFTRSVLYAFVNICVFWN